jgi:hypothetical protein
MIINSGKKPARTEQQTEMLKIVTVPDGYENFPIYNLQHHIYKEV